MRTGAIDALVFGAYLVVIQPSKRKAHYLGDTELNQPCPQFHLSRL
jgi:hypothetical protein